jgi:SAM-dependent methyltransferase
MFLPLDLGDPGRELPAPVEAPSLEEAFARLRAAAPLSWENYRRCLDTGTASYDGLPPESCSTEAHPQSLLFRAFLRPYLRGFVLDIGCGPQPVPSYLMPYPVERIVGIDPISKQADHPFRFVSGVGEYLPFADASFDVLVSGTTLDHYYLLDQGLREAARVLVPGGHFVAWITEVAGAPEYDPYSRAAEPFDSEHMYHIDRAWFLPLMRRMGFREAEIVAFRRPFPFLFMSFEKL